MPKKGQKATKKEQQRTTRPSKNSAKGQEIDLLETWTSNRILVFAQATGYTVAVMAVVIGLGYLLDKQFGTFPAIFIISMVIAFPLAQIFIYKKIKSFAHKQVDKYNDK